MSEYATFRRDLDAVLIKRDSQALRVFLIERGQWDEDTTMDPEAAMWLMIAASPTLPQFHGEAKNWLKAHGRGADAATIGGEGGDGTQPPPSRPRAKRPPRRDGGKGTKS